MVFKDAFVKLMENIRCKTCKYVGMWKIHPEWIIDRPNPFFRKGSKPYAHLLYVWEWPWYVPVLFLDILLALLADPVGLYILGNDFPYNMPPNIAQENPQHKPQEWEIHDKCVCQHR